MSDDLNISEGSSVPVATKELLDSVGTEGKSAINSVYMIVCPKTNSKGTSFLIKKEGVLVTNEHVIRGNNHEDIIGISSSSEKISFKDVIFDARRDLAILVPNEPLDGGLILEEDSDIKPGLMLCTWGFPLMYSGPSPLLAAGFLSGFLRKDGVKRLIVNGAFNSGNSGGPLLRMDDDKVVGVVVAKQLPLLTPFVASAIKVLADNKSGLIYTATDNKGVKKEFAESQIVAEILSHYHKMHQVVIGEAIESDEVIEFLKEKGLR